MESMAALAWNTPPVIFQRRIPSSQVLFNGLFSFEAPSANLRAQRYCHVDEFRKRFVHAAIPVLVERGVAVHNRRLRTAMGSG
jgi:hypothetical protein